MWPYALLLIALAVAVPYAAASPVTIYPTISTWTQHACGDTAEFGRSGYSDTTPYTYSAIRADGVCYASVHSFLLDGFVGKPIHNATLDVTLHSEQEYSCKLLAVRGDVHVGTIAPTEVVQYLCGGGSAGDAYTISMEPYLPELQAAADAGEQTVSVMIVPALPANGAEQIERGLSLTVNATGSDCIYIQASRYCGFFESPWNAMKKILGEDYIGDWFYILIWFPIPMVVYLTTRNGTYAGFVGMGIMISIQTIDQTVFEISLSMIAISAGFLFYEILRKRLFAEGG